MTMKSTIHGRTGFYLTVPTGTAVRITTDVDPAGTTRMLFDSVILVSDDGAATNGNTNDLISIGAADVAVLDPGIRKGASVIIESKRGALVDLHQIYAVSAVVGQKLMVIPVG